MTLAESESDTRITTDTPYLALTGELWAVYCKDMGENWPRYNGTALYYVLCWQWNREHVGWMGLTNPLQTNNMT